MPLTLQQLNHAPPEEALQMLDGLYEHSPWIAAQALQERAFRSLAQLKHVMVRVLASAGQDAQLALIRAHPELAGKAMASNTLTAESTNEQKQAGLTRDQMDWIELNEAFAAQALAVIRDLGLDPAKVNPLGGAIALGHPLGATGAVRVATLTHGLQRRKQKYGMVTMCIGTGMGAAGIFESL